MPEGPEVRTIARALRPFLVGSILTRVTLTPRAKQSGLESLPIASRLEAVSTHGKKIFFVLAAPGGETYKIVTSLGMEGRWSWTPGAHSHIALTLARVSIAGGVLRSVRRTLYFDDTRYFGSVVARLTGGPDPAGSAQASPITAGLDYDLGPDPLAEAIPAHEWRAIFRNPRIGRWQICKVLMDQSVIAGIGNYLKAEILYRGRVRPDRRVNELSDEDLENIRVATHEIMEKSYAAGGFTIESFWSPDGVPGGYAPDVYGLPVDSGGNPVIKTTFTDGRTTHWVPAVQN